MGPNCTFTLVSLLAEPLCTRAQGPRPATTQLSFHKNLCGTYTAAPAMVQHPCDPPPQKAKSLSQSRLTTVNQCRQQFEEIEFLSGALPVGAEAMAMVLTVCVKSRSPGLCISFQVSPCVGPGTPLQDGSKPPSCIFCHFLLCCRLLSQDISLSTYKLSYWMVQSFLCTPCLQKSHQLIFY